MRHDKHAGAGGIRVVVAAAAVLLLAAASWQVWQRMHGDAPPSGRAAPPPPAGEGTGVHAEELLPATLYLPVNGMLAAQSFALRRYPEPQLQARAAAAALLGEQRGLRAPVLRDVSLRSLYLDEAGTAFLDLAPRQPLQQANPASAWDELLALYAMVNTIMLNVPEVRQVRFLLNGRETRTLAGHLDLSRGFVRRTELVRSQ